MDQAYLQGLEKRFGNVAVTQWWNQAEVAARMAFDSMVAISVAAGKPAAPEGLAVVFRYQAEDPGGLCAVAAVSAAGPMKTDAKVVLLARALSALEAGNDVLLVEDKRTIVTPPSFSSVREGAVAKVDGEAPKVDGEAPKVDGEGGPDR